MQCYKTDVGRHVSHRWVAGPVLHVFGPTIADPPRNPARSSGSRDRAFWGQPKCIPSTSGVSALVRFLSVRPRVLREAVRSTPRSRSDHFRKVWYLTPTGQKCQVLLSL